MEASKDRGKRFSREGAIPRLAEVTRAEAAELDLGELLDRLEEQAAESGRLKARLESLQRQAHSEREARRRLASTLKRERQAAAALHERAEQHREAHAAAAEELERLREAATVTELHVQQAWTRLAEAEHRLAHQERGFWQRLLGRAPRRG